MDDEEVWIGDDEEPELPVLGTPEPEVSPGKRRRRGPAPQPRGGVPTEMASEARRRVIADATGTGTKEPERWREELSLGQRDRAAGTLSSSGKAKGGGFGLA